MKAMKYTIVCYNTDDFGVCKTDRAEIEVLAADEKEAIRISKDLLTREKYNVIKIRENK